MVNLPVVRALISRTGMKMILSEYLWH